MGFLTLNHLYFCIFSAGIAMGVIIFLAAVRSIVYLLTTTPGMSQVSTTGFILLALGIAAGVSWCM